MASKTLARLVDQAIVPAVFLVAGKILGVFLVSRCLNLTWEFSGFGLFFPIKEEATLVNTYSSLVMFAFAWLGFVSIVISSHFFHDTHISPHFAARLSSFGLLHLVESTYELYTKAVVWLAYVWLLAGTFTLQVYFGGLYYWLSVVCVSVSVVTTVVFVIDIEREVHSVQEEKKSSSSVDFTNQSSGYFY